MGVGGGVAGGGVVDLPPVIIGRYTLFSAAGAAGAAQIRLAGAAAQISAMSADSSTAMRVERLGRMLDMQTLQLQMRVIKFTYI